MSLTNRYLMCMQTDDQRLRSSADADVSNFNVALSGGNLPHGSPNSTPSALAIDTRPKRLTQHPPLAPNRPIQLLMSSDRVGWLDNKNTKIGRLGLTALSCGFQLNRSIETQRISYFPIHTTFGYPSSPDRNSGSSSKTPASTASIRSIGS